VCQPAVPSKFFASPAEATNALAVMRPMPGNLFQARLASLKQRCHCNLRQFTDLGVKNCQGDRAGAESATGNRPATRNWHLNQFTRVAICPMPAGVKPNSGLTAYLIGLGRAEPSQALAHPVAASTLCCSTFLMGTKRMWEPDSLPRKSPRRQPTSFLLAGLDGA
jgi:hypothetical protein